MPYQDKQGRLCGFLNIEETEGSSSFCRRYFVLDQNNGKLVYYMDSLGNLPEAWKSPVGEIYMHSISKVTNGDAVRPKLQFCLIITVAGRQYFLQAETEEDKLQWMEAIKNASKITRKSWKRRYFTLHHMGLSYSKSEQDKQPIRTIPLQDILESRPSDGTQLHRDNLFEVLTSKRIFYIQCDSPQDMNRWIEAIRAAIRQRRLEERKSMQDPSGRHPLEEELRGGSYPSPIWV
ncbi:pleckstrin homology domain-containing family A member 1 [Elysia marginata]|uniref:Pleckstrin homology domain-containing family A member 1 n=1 Tax=Elysia marginata TaxID=1093978 RepID=A0AAV4FCF8_9GAST|nr:pleckstrin homology domain-containing family A member 1 [Elysia marginata]